MNKKLTSILLLMVLLIPLSAVFVYANALAVPSFVNPGSNGVLRNGNLFNVSFSDGNVTACAIFARDLSSTPSQNSTSSLIINITNTTGTNAARGYLNGTLDSSIVLGDSNGYNFGAICYNSTSEVRSTTNSTSVTLDRSNPTAASAITFTNPLKDGNTITSTITRGDTNRCFIRFGGPSVARRSMVLSGSTCTYTVTKYNPPNSAYQAFIETDDNDNSTLSTQQNIQVKAVSSDGGGLFSGSSFEFEQPSKAQSILGGGTTNPFAPKPKENNWAFWAAIGFVAYLLLSKKN